MRTSTLLLLFILLFSLSFRAGFSASGGYLCVNCDADDCSDDYDSGNTACYSPSSIGCIDISEYDTSAYGSCPSTKIVCDSTNLEKQSDDAGFGSNGFVYDSSHPYYCTDYNQTGNYTWKTCYDGAPDANWYSVQLACSNGELYECTDKSGISGTAKGDCGSITVNSQKLYCDGSSSKWVFPSDVKEHCSGACSDAGGTWTGSACCDSGDDYIDSSDESKACDSGTVKTCDSSSCGSTVSVGSTTYYCDGSSWTSSPDPDSCEGVCTALGYAWDDSANKCCNDADNFVFNSDSSRICDGGSVYSCTSAYLCNQRDGYTCIKDDAGNYAWVSGDCSSSGACIDGSWNSGGCNVLDGWYNYGNTTWCGDDPTAEYRDYSCSSGSCTYSVTETKDCDSSDNWYGGGNEQGFDDPAVEHRDYYVDSNGNCVYYVCETDDSCDSSDVTSDSCIDENTMAGGVDYCWPAVYNSSKPGGCESQILSSVDCTREDSVDTDGGDDPWEKGVVTDFTSCSGGECVGDTYADSCNGNVLTEYYPSGTSYASKQYDCSSFSTCGINTACSGGKCQNSTVDPDSSEDQCDLCGKVWINGKCCGDDSGEDFYGETVLCDDGVAYDISGSSACESHDVGGVWYFALNGKWVTAGEANASCEDACTRVGGRWQDGEILQGFRCCLDDSGGSLLSVNGIQAICNGTGWMLADDYSGQIYSAYYLSDGSVWSRCDSVGEEKEVNGVSFVCTEQGWQNKQCAELGDDDRTLCEQTCGGTWLGLGGSRNCCGNGADDEFSVDESRICDGTEGLKVCETNCSTVEFSDGTVYYCFGGEWATSSDFSGAFYRSFDGSAGCCSERDCWIDGCVESGYVQGDLLCASGEWKRCEQLCSSVSLPEGTFYCTDTGWDVSRPLTCNASRGVCDQGVCRLCGVDYQKGEVVNGLLCTSQGIFSRGCLSDQDCPAGECSTGKCVNGQCVVESLPCGSACSNGVCDGSGSCVSVSGEGASCSCGAMCGTGLTCSNGECTRLESCGDGVCDAGECTGCPQDCSVEDCAGNGVCDVPVGENCKNSPDCECGLKVCRPESSLADSWGCVPTACGNGVCEKGECSACPQDCSLQDCAGNGVCDFAVGENCSNSADCKCDVKIEYDRAPVLKVGEEKVFKIFAENTGNVPVVVNLDLTAKGISVGGGERIFLQPGEKRETYVTMKALESGAKKVEVLAKTDRGVDLKAGEMTVIVKTPNPLEAFADWFYSTPLNILFDFKELIFTGFAILTGLWKYISRSKPVSPYGSSAYTYYYGYGRGYPQFQYRRGYYRW